MQWHSGKSQNSPVSTTSYTAISTEMTGPQCAAEDSGFSPASITEGMEDSDDSDPEPPSRLRTRLWFYCRSTQCRIAARGLLVCCLFVIPVIFALRPSTIDNLVPHVTPSVCSGGVMPNSDHADNASACWAGSLGDECFYECNPGYISIGRHVCQDVTVGGKMFMDHKFFGGRCVRLCHGSNETCPIGQTPVRSNAQDTSGACVSTVACAPKDTALRDLALGNYELWRIARSDRSGVYVDHVDLTMHQTKVEGQNNLQGSTDTTGIGLIVECIADAMGWIPRQEFIDRVGVTLKAFANTLDSNWHLPRGPTGWLPRYFNVLNGAPFDESQHIDSGVWSTMATGTLYTGVLFVRTYLRNHPNMSTAEDEIIKLTYTLMAMVDWSSMTCEQKGGGSPDSYVAGTIHATGISYLQRSDGSCHDVLWPSVDDGYYDFNEMMTTIWLSYNAVCPRSNRSACEKNSSSCVSGCTGSVATAWKAWQGRRFHPNVNFSGYTLLSTWSAYIHQIPYYTSHAFNSDPEYLKLFKNAWLADLADYKSRAFYEGHHRYGLGAGPNPAWCSDGKLYTADRLEYSEKNTGCRMWSPYAIAGYLPVAPEVIKDQLLLLLAEGESRLPFQPEREGLDVATGIAVLGRKSFLDPMWNSSSWVTMIDIGSEILGLSTLWLGTDFFVKGTDHFSEDKPLDARRMAATTSSNRYVSDVRV